MLRSLKNICLMLTLVSLAFGAEEKYKAIYMYALDDVVRSPNAINEFKSHRIIDYSVKDSVPLNKFYPDTTLGEFRFTDRLLDMYIIPGINGVNISIKNLGYSSVRVIWNEAVFVSSNGKADNVFHAQAFEQKFEYIKKGHKRGRKKVEKEYDNSPTIIPQEAYFEDYLFPDISPHDDQSYNTDEPFPMLPQYPTWDKVKTKAQAIPLMGKTLRFLLPIEYNGNRYEYTIVLKINEIDSVN